MPLLKANWDSNKDLPVGKGATVQQFFTTLGKDRFEINVAPWGEGQLKVNGLEIARTAEAKDRHQAFTRLKQAAEKYARGEPLETPGNGKARLIPAVKAKLLEGKKGSWWVSQTSDRSPGDVPPLSAPSAPIWQLPISTTKPKNTSIHWRARLRRRS